MPLLSKRAKVTSDTPAYKKKEKSETGKNIYEYSESHLKKRQKEKSDKLNKLEKELVKVRKQYKGDLKSDDLRDRAIACIVGIIDNTAMRVGNPQSSSGDDGAAATFGATTLKASHVKISGNTVKFDFPGKGSVEQHLKLTDSAIASVLKELTKGKSKGDYVFEIDGKRIWDRAVNRYLKPMGISAKDLRGFHANHIMKEMLKTKNFKDALKETAEEIGHTESVLKNQYLEPKLVEKHEKKAAALSYRTAEHYEENAAMAPPLENIMPPEPTVPVDIAMNVSNVDGDIANYPRLINAWSILAPFLPEGAKITSGWRSDNEQARIILDYWLSAVWKPGTSGESWDRDKGFFNTNFPGPKTSALRYWRQLASDTKPISGRRYRQLQNTIEPLRSIMTSYAPNAAPGEPPAALKIAPLGTSNHLKGLAFDIGGAPLSDIQHAASYINASLSPLFSRILPEKGQDVVHVVISPSTQTITADALTKALEEYEQLLSARGSVKEALDQSETKYVDTLESKYFGTGPSARQTDNRPSADRKLPAVKPGVELNPIIEAAWATLLPHLPKGAVMTSGARSSEKQIDIINNYWRRSGLNNLHPNVSDPAKRSKLLIAAGWIVGPPTSKSRDGHLQGRAMDVSGANLEEIAAAAHKVSRDSNIPVLFSQILVEPKQNSVHIGIRDAKLNVAAVIESLVSIADIDEDEADIESELESIYEDLLDSNPPDDIIDELGSVLSSVSSRYGISARGMDDYSQFKLEMGAGTPDEPGEWFEKSPIFRYREEDSIPEYEDTSADATEAQQLAADSPDQFFYRGLHREYPDLEVEALGNIIKDDPKFYFIFKYHESDNSEFKDLLEEASEALAQHDVRAFFYYHMHHIFPELGRGAIIQLINTNPESFHEFGLGKDYPDYLEAAGNAMNIEDPSRTRVIVVEDSRDE